MRIAVYGSSLLSSRWEEKKLPPNARRMGHVPTRDQNAFNATPLAVLSVAGDDAAQLGYVPSARVFEAAGAGACLISDAWKGIELFFEPGREVLVARDENDVVEHLQHLTPAAARLIGQRARARILSQHTYVRRAAEVHQMLTEALLAKRHKSAA